MIVGIILKFKVSDTTPINDGASLVVTRICFGKKTCWFLAQFVLFTFYHTSPGPTQSI